MVQSLTKKRRIPELDYPYLSLN